MAVKSGNTTSEAEDDRWILLLNVMQCRGGESCESGKKAKVHGYERETGSAKLAVR